MNNTLSKAKQEILRDIKVGLVPQNIESFVQLHNFVDANCYGGFCNKTYTISENFEFENEIQNELDQWIKNGFK